MSKINYLKLTVFQTCLKRSQTGFLMRKIFKRQDRQTDTHLQICTQSHYSDSKLQKYPSETTVLHLSACFKLAFLVRPGLNLSVAYSKPLSSLLGMSWSSPVYNKSVKSQIPMYCSGCFPSTSHQSTTLADSS